MHNDRQYENEVSEELAEVLNALMACIVRKKSGERGAEWMRLMELTSFEMSFIIGCNVLFTTCAGFSGSTIAPLEHTHISRKPCPSSFMKAGDLLMGEAKEWLIV